MGSINTCAFSRDIYTLNNNDNKLTIMTAYNGLRAPYAALSGSATLTNKFPLTSTLTLSRVMALWFGMSTARSRTSIT